MLGVQPELPQGPADIIRHGTLGRSPGPAAVPAAVFETNLAAVGKIQCGLGESRIWKILRGFLLCVLAVVHPIRVTKVEAGPSEIIGGSMFIALFVILLLLWILGFTTMHVASAAIHILLILAIISLIVHFVRPHHGPPAA